jgi:phage terminase small subunit
VAKGALNPKHARFVQEYLKDLNATKAAKRTGYSEKTARQQGAHLLSIPAIQDAISEGTREGAFDGKVTRKRIVQELARIAFGDARKVMSWGPEGVDLIDSKILTDDEAAQVAEISETTTQHGGTIKLKRFDKVKALELLGRHIGMFGDVNDDDAPKDDVVVYLPANGR